MGTTVKYPLPPVGMAAVSKPTNSRCWGGCGDRGPLVPCRGDADPAAPVHSSAEVPRKIRNGPAFCPRDSTSGGLARGDGSPDSKRRLHPVSMAPPCPRHPRVHGSRVHASRHVGATACPSSGGRVDKREVVCTDGRIQLRHKEEGNLAFATTRLDLEGIRLVKRVGERKTNAVGSHLCGI